MRPSGRDARESAEILVTEGGFSGSDSDALQYYRVAQDQLPVPGECHHNLPHGSSGVLSMIHRTNQKARQPRKPSRQDEGMTFIEVLVSVVLLGTVGLAVLVAMSAALVGARVNDNLAQVQQVLAEAADAMTDTQPERVAYVACSANPAAAYQTAINALHPPAGSVTVGTESWDRTAGGGQGAFGPTCRFVQGDRLQRVTLTAKVGGVLRTVKVVKRPYTVPTADIVPAPPAPPYAGGSGQAIVSLTPGIDG